MPTNMPTTQDYDEHDEPTNSPSYLNQNIDNFRLLVNMRDALKQAEIVALAAGGGASPATTVTGPDAYGASAVVGTGTTYARSDHDHGLPAAPAVPAPSTTVTGPDAYGASAVVGTGTTYARSDHDHGLPAAVAVPAAATTVTGPDAYGASASAGSTTSALSTWRR